MNRKAFAQNFALRFSDAYLYRYSIKSISFPILSTVGRNLFSNIYILAKNKHYPFVISFTVWYCWIQ